MTKPSLLRARSAFERFCLENSIVNDRVEVDPCVLAFFVPETSGEQEQLEKLLSESARQSALQLKIAPLPSGQLYVLAAGTLSETDMANLADDAASCYNKFYARLSQVLGAPIDETNLRQPDSALRRANAGNQFPASMRDYVKPGAKRKLAKRNMDAKIEEALEGIATPDDIQPRQGLKSLFSALKRSGLDRELKSVDVSWHVAEPGKHAITFVKGDTPILQLTAIELGDAKKLGEVLSQLTSIAQGKAPQAAELELDRVKEMASRANERKRALDSVAQQFAVPKPEEQQPITTARPQV